MDRDPRLKRAPKVGHRRLVRVPLRLVDLLRERESQLVSEESDDADDERDERTLSSLTFQALTLAFGGSVVHCG